MSEERNKNHEDSPERRRERSEGQERGLTLAKIASQAGIAAFATPYSLFLSPAAEMLFSFIRSPSERHTAELIADLNAKLELLIDEGRIDREELFESEAFSSVVIQAIRSAGETREHEKRAYLRNAALNAALDETIPEIETAIFMDLLNRYTSLHIALLKLCVPNERGIGTVWFPNLGGHVRVVEIKSYGIEEAFKEALGENQFGDDFLKIIYESLKFEGVIVTESLDKPHREYIDHPKARHILDNEHSVRCAHAITTDLGQSFLNFIADPTE